MLDTKLALDILCIKANQTEFEQATTLLLDVSTNFNANVTYQVTVGFEMYTLDVQYTGYENATIDMASKIRVNTEIQVIVGTVEGFLEAFFDKGHSFQNILLKTPLCWLDIN